MNKDNFLKHIINETIRQTLMESGMFDKTATPVATKTDAQRELGINPLRTDVGNHGGNEEVRQPSTQDWNGANFKGKLIIIPDKKFTFYKVKQFGNPDIKDTSSLFGGTGKGNVELKRAIDTVNGAATRNGKSVTYRFITSETNNEKYKISQNPGRTIGTFCEFSYDDNQWFIMKPHPVQNLKISSFKEPISENKQYKTNRNIKRTIRLTESEIINMINESVKRVLNEAVTDFRGIPYMFKVVFTYHKDEQQYIDYEWNGRDNDELSRTVPRKKTNINESLTADIYFCEEALDMIKDDELRVCDLPYEVEASNISVPQNLAIPILEGCRSGLKREGNEIAEKYILIDYVNDSNQTVIGMTEFSVEEVTRYRIFCCKPSDYKQGDIEILKFFKQYLLGN